MRSTGSLDSSQAVQAGGLRMTEKGLNDLADFVRIDWFS